MTTRPTSNNPLAPREPKVSFIALCFNHEAYVLDCLRSIEAQHWPNAELVIMDNASDDGSAAAIQKWAATTTIHTSVILQKERRGLCANANTLLGHATGEYVAMIATDDYWLPHKTSSQVAAMEAIGPRVAVAYGDALRVDAAGQALDPPSFINFHREFGALPGGDIFRELVRGPFIPAMSTMIRRSALQAIGGFDESLVYEDYDVWLRLAEHWHFHADDKPLCAYRVLGSSMIRTVAAQDRPEKILSDARIMAKVAAMPRLDAKTRINVKRRVVSLAMQLISMPGCWGDALGELNTTAAMNVLDLLVTATRDQGRIPLESSQRLLAAAVRFRYLAGDDGQILPKSLMARPTMTGTTASAGRGSSANWRDLYPYMEVDPGEGVAPELGGGLAGPGN